MSCITAEDTPEAARLIAEEMINKVRKGPEKLFAPVQLSKKGSVSLNLLFRKL